MLSPGPYTSYLWSLCLDIPSPRNSAVLCRLGGGTYTPKRGNPPPSSERCISDVSNLRSGLGRDGILVPQANQLLTSTSLEARPRCSACLISASRRQPWRSSLRSKTLNRPA